MIFDKAWQHFVIEDGKYSENYTSCCYRTEDGRMCAVGCALSDEQAKLADGLVISLFGCVVKKYPDWFAYDILSLNEDVLNNIQCLLHDDLQYEINNCMKDVIEDKYRQVAKLYNLSIPGESPNV